MGSMRYRRRIKVAPGLTLNVNKKSVSVTALTNVECVPESVRKFFED